MLQEFARRIAFAVDATLTGRGRVATIAAQIVVAVLAAHMALCAGQVATRHGAYEVASPQSAQGAEAKALWVRS